jgi:hypothetical protein
MNDELFKQRAEDENGQMISVNSLSMPIWMCGPCMLGQCEDCTCENFDTQEVCSCHEQGHIR